jgi:membrane protease YdiL (CAAX protease family)
MDAAHSDELSRTGAYRATTPWGAWPALAATVVILLVALLFSTGVMRLVFGPGVARGGGRATNDAAILLAWLGAMQVATVVLTLMASRQWRGRLADVLALSWPVQGWRGFIAAIAGLAVMAVTLNIVFSKVLGLDATADLQGFTWLVRHERWWLALIVLGVGAPLMEELLFRGFLQSALAQRAGYLGAAIVTTALWTLLHAGYSAAGIIEVAAAGAVFAFFLWWTGSLWVCIAAHAAYNTALVLLLYWTRLLA